MANRPRFPNPFKLLLRTPSQPESSGVHPNSLHAKNPRYKGGSFHIPRYSLSSIFSGLKPKKSEEYMEAQEEAKGIAKEINDLVDELVNKYNANRSKYEVAALLEELRDLPPGSPKYETLYGTMEKKSADFFSDILCHIQLKAFYVTQLGMLKGTASKANLNLIRTAIKRFECELKGLARESGNFEFSEYKKRIANE